MLTETSLAPTLPETEIAPGVDLQPATGPLLCPDDALDSLLRLPAGWDSYGAASITVRAVATARAIVRVLSAIGAIAPAICPRPCGGVLLEWTCGDWSALDIGPDGMIETDDD